MNNDLSDKIHNGLVYELQEGEVTHIDIFPPSREWEEDAHGGESWANELCHLATVNRDTLYAPDYDGTTTGDSKGINVLILTADLPYWEAACREIGCEWEIQDDDPGTAHYGDGHWAGVDLAIVGPTIYWITL
jgi:hypothetical protein